MNNKFRNMKFVAISFATLLIAGCNQSQDAEPTKALGSINSSSHPIVAIDVSTPDRAIKSYWMMKDTFRKADFDFVEEQTPELQKLYNKIGFNIGKLMVSDVLSFHQVWVKPTQKQFKEYSREIVDIKQDTESRATVVVKVINSTPIPDGVIVSDSDKKLLETGERLKYVLEKEADGWKVAQVYKFDEFYAKYRDDKDPWSNLFKASTDISIRNVRVNEYEN